MCVESKALYKTGPAARLGHAGLLGAAGSRALRTRPPGLGRPGPQGRAWGSTWGASIGSEGRGGMWAEGEVTPWGTVGHPLGIAFSPSLREPCPIAPRSRSGRLWMRLTCLPFKRGQGHGTRSCSTLPIPGYYVQRTKENTDYCKWSKIIPCFVAN